MMAQDVFIGSPPRDLSFHLQIREGIKRLKQSAKLRVGVSERWEMHGHDWGHVAGAKKDNSWIQCAHLPLGTWGIKVE